MANSRQPFIARPMRENQPQQNMQQAGYQQQQQQYLQNQWSAYWSHQQPYQQSYGVNHAVSFALGQGRVGYQPPQQFMQQPIHFQSWPQRTTADGYGVSQTAGNMPFPEPMLEKQPVYQQPQFNRQQNYNQQPRQPIASTSKLPGTVANECTSCQKRFANKVDLIAHRMHHVKCDYPKCTYSGDPHALLIHKEDRHLIFAIPKRKPELSLDEQRALQDPVARMIQGTSIKLDTPEAIAAWIEERKKRWPSAKNVEEKQKLKAASQTTSNKRNLPSTSANKTEPLFHKKQRIWNNPNENASDNPNSAKQSPKVKYRTSGKSADEELPETNNDNAPPASDQEGSEHASDNEVDSDEEILSRTLPVPTPMSAPKNDSHQRLYHSTILEDFEQEQARRDKKRQQRDRLKQTTSKVDLLQSLLKKDVDQEMLDLAHVAEFLLRNNFLRNVELKAGESAPMIQDCSAPMIQDCSEKA